MRWALGFVIVLLAHSASASVIVDGKMAADEFTSPTEYAWHVLDQPDPAEAEYIGTGLDISGMCFANAGGQLYLGLRTASTLDTDGDPTGFQGSSYFLANFLDNASNYLYRLRITMAGTATPTVQFYRRQGNSWVSTALSGYTLAIGECLEIALNEADLPLLPANAPFQARLDGMGTWMDDQMLGQVPEPVTLLLLAAGLPLLLRRRR
jgi:hypothetical protein